MDWFLYDNGLRHERVNLSESWETYKTEQQKKCFFYITGKQFIWKLFHNNNNRMRKAGFIYRNLSSSSIFGYKSNSQSSFFQCHYPKRVELITSLIIFLTRPTSLHKKSKFSSTMAEFLFICVLNFEIFLKLSHFLRP